MDYYVNTKSLLNQLNNVPRPSYIDQKYIIQVPHRIDELNLQMLSPHIQCKPSKVTRCTEIILTAVEYRIGSTHKWLEWEMKI